MSTVSKGVYGVRTLYDINPVLAITKISTFERNGIVKSLYIDYNNGSCKNTKSAALFRYKNVRDFKRKAKCLTINYYKDGQYRYTCRTWSETFKEDKTVKKEF